MKYTTTKFTRSGYFRLAATFALGMEITYVNILFCSFIPYQIRDKKVSMRDYNNRTVYDCFNNPFPVGCGITYLNLLPMPIDGSIPKK